jgi:hypothetical protein
MAASLKILLSLKRIKNKNTMAVPPSPEIEIMTKTTGNLEDRIEVEINIEKIQGITPGMIEEIQEVKEKGKSN